MYKKINSIDLSVLDINFSRFRKDLVNFYFRHTTNLYSINLKHRPNQKSDKLSGQHLSINTTWIDNLMNLEYIKSNMNSADQSITENDYTLYNQEVIDNFAYIIECIGKIEKHTNLKFGRIRLLLLAPRSLLPLHYDFGSIRYHIPIVTSDDSFFLSNEELCVMPEYDRLYQLPSDTTHTAINFSNKMRLHLMMVSNNEVNNIDLPAHCSDAITNAKQYMDDADEVDLIFNQGYYAKLENLIDDLT
jgi:hypothetical protein